MQVLSSIRALPWTYRIGAGCGDGSGENQCPKILACSPKAEGVNILSRICGILSQVHQGICRNCRGYTPVRSKGHKGSTALNHEANQPFNERWTSKCQLAFETLIDRLTAAPVLGFANPKQPYILHTDASTTGLEAALYQEQEGQLRVIAYASRGLSASESRYPAHKLEFLALKWSVTEKFHDYLYGTRFVVVTDNNPLTYILSSAKLDAAGHRWLAALSTFDFKLQYRAGSQSRDADALSRGPHDLPDEDRCQKEWDMVQQFTRDHVDEMVVSLIQMLWLPYVTAVNIRTSWPLELLCMDYLTLEADKSNTKDILVFTDHFTKYALAFPTANQKVKTVAKCLWENFIVHYGTPERLHTDQGHDLESHLIRELCDIAGIKKTRTTPYLPRGNPVERFIRTLLSMLGMLGPEQKQRWKEYVKPLVHAYNCTRNEVTGYTPYELMFGHSPRLPVDLAYGLPVGDRPSPSHSKYVQILRSRLRMINLGRCERCTETSCSRVVSYLGVQSQNFHLLHSRCQWGTRRIA